MQKTETYQFNLIEGSDAFSQEPINENTKAMEAILARLPRIQTGSYIGTGGHGEDNPTTLTFDFEPKFLMVWSSTSPYRAMAIRGKNIWVMYGEHGSGCTTTWEGNTVSWYFYAYSGDGSYAQLNAGNSAYQYLAIG